jgi:hypothetical protein
MSLQGKRVISGTWGSIWVDSEKINECFGLTATVELKREEVKIAGQMWTESKLVGVQGKGSIKMNKVTTRFVEKVFNIIETGEDAVFEIQSMLADPDAINKGKEVIRLKNVVFDELTLQDWEVGTPGTFELPFSFSGAYVLERIEG